MLKNILSPADCADCRICCVFDRYDLWETPTVPAEMKDALSELDPSLEFISKGNSFRFRMEEDEDGLYYCPMLTETGCKLGDSKPVECRIWPYRVMELRGQLVIGVASICPTMYNKPLRLLKEELDNGLADIIFAEAKKCPDMIKDYSESYPILKIGMTVSEFFGGE
ncbi:MAG: hypothetical protein PUK49_07065 [Oscillospiraceae bacterium]|nr:hypothetical protein [Oscillospiraceae bacterium]